VAVLMAGSFVKVNEIALWSEVMREFETCQFEMFGVTGGVVRVMSMKLCPLEFWKVGRVPGLFIMSRSFCVINSYWKTCIVQAVKPQGSRGIEIASATCSRLDKPLDGWDFRPNVYRWRQVDARKVHNGLSYLCRDHYNAVGRELRDEEGL
jgi:hypothetical protein